MSASSTTMTNGNLLPTPHPGEILALEFMESAGLSQNALARALRVPPRRINELVHGKREIAAELLTIQPAPPDPIVTLADRFRSSDTASVTPGERLNR
jgi:hypothetical protein